MWTAVTFHGFGFVIMFQNVGETEWCEGITLAFIEFTHEFNPEIICKDKN